MSPHAEDPRDGPRTDRVTENASSPMSNGLSQSTRLTNGVSPTPASDEAQKSHLRRASGAELYDLICVGFGPANLALAIALHDALDETHAPAGLNAFYHRPPKLLFLERQGEFRWHKGMLLPGAKMQISFVKDLATLRNPRSEFTFLNYLHKKGRMSSFTNLNTFLPQRVEYEDYMRWCAASFSEVVEYKQEVIEIRPESGLDTISSKTTSSFSVVARDLKLESIRSFSTRNVVLALGGKPQIPAPLPQHHDRVFHSAHYSMKIDEVLPDQFHPYKVAVIGCGQSAAEIFTNLHSRFPNSTTRLIIRGASLRPSDDSPFVNEIFDPDQVDPFYYQPPERREASIAEDRGTNYGVVRIGLLEQIYEDLYMQRLQTRNQEEWPHQILTHRQIVDVQTSEDSVKLQILNQSQYAKSQTGEKETLEVDAVIVATGYTRDVHEEVLEPIKCLLPAKSRPGDMWTVSREYKLELDAAKVSSGSGIWLTGCNEYTHGLSDTLLSVQATRGGELARSIFGD